MLKDELLEMKLFTAGLLDRPNLLNFTGIYRTDALHKITTNPVCVLFAVNIIFLWFGLLVHARRLTPHTERVDVNATDVSTVPLLTTRVFGDLGVTEAHLIRAQENANSRHELKQNSVQSFIFGTPVKTGAIRDVRLWHKLCRIIIKATPHAGTCIKWYLQRMVALLNLLEVSHGVPMPSGYTAPENEYDEVSNINEINHESEVDLSEPDSIYDAVGPDEVEYDEVSELPTTKSPSSSSGIYDVPSSDPYVPPEYQPPSRKSSYYKSKSKKSYSSVELEPEPVEYDDVTCEVESEPNKSSKVSSASPIEYDDAPYDCKLISLLQVSLAFSSV